MFGATVAEPVNPRKTGYKPETYDKTKARNAENQRKMSAAGREIGPLPEVVDVIRRGLAEQSLRVWCETYFRQTFQLGWSQDHLRAIDRLEEAILSGGQFALAMPRGSGKSSLCLAAVMWAAMTGRRAFSLLIGATEADAEESLDIISAELEGNDLLAEDFPEVCHPIRCLEGIHQRKLLLNGKPVAIQMQNKEIVLPDVVDSKCRGFLIKVAGLTGRMRGFKHKTPDGKTVRPSLVILDDPQTDESANSISQCATRERILNGAVLGLAGPGQSIAAVMPCTVIADGDMADRVLDRSRNPQWHGERTRFLIEEAAVESPAHKLWLEYCDIRKRCQREDRSTEEATEFYAARREQMDAGYVASWIWRYNDDELSAVQHAWNVICDRGESAFRAEYQNQPIKQQFANEYKLSADELCVRLTRLQRGVVPVAASRLTAFVDVQGACLYWLVAAWSDNFTGSVIDYGSFPDQALSYFTIQQVKRTIQQRWPSHGPEAQLYAALTECVDGLMGREWNGENGASLRIERLMIDANWGESTDTVKLFCRQSRHASSILPSHGKYVGASGTALNDRGVNPGDRVGTHWRIPAADRARPVRYALWDSNYWKSFVAARLRSGLGSPGALTLFGDNPGQHRMICDHLTAEYATRVTARGRDIEEWRLYPGRDNHWWDCLVGAAVAASICGAKLLDTGAETGKKKVKFSQIQAQKR